MVGLKKGFDSRESERTSQDTRNAKTETWAPFSELYLMVHQRPLECPGHNIVHSHDRR